MSHPPARRFGLLDGMILVAGIAVGFAVEHDFQSRLRSMGGFGTDIPMWLMSACRVLHGLTLGVWVTTSDRPAPRCAGFSGSRAWPRSTRP